MFPITAFWFMLKTGNVTHHHFLSFSFVLTPWRASAKTQCVYRKQVSFVLFIALTIWSVGCFLVSLWPFLLRLLLSPGAVFTGYYNNNPPGLYFSMAVFLTLLWALLKAGLVTDVFSVLSISLAHKIPVSVVSVHLVIVKSCCRTCSVFEWDELHHGHFHIFGHIETDVELLFVLLSCQPNHEYLLALFNFVREKGLTGYVAELMQLTFEVSWSLHTLLTLIICRQAEGFNVCMCQQMASAGLTLDSLDCLKNTAEFQQVVNPASSGSQR